MAENEYLSKDEAVALLRRSVDEWNAYRKAHPGYNPELRTANFGKADLSEANLTMIDLQSSNFQGACLRRVNFSKANLCEIFFKNADLKGVNFGGTNLHRADLSAAKLHEADFSGANLNYTNLKNSRLTAAMFDGTKLNRTDFSKAKIAYAVFVDVDLSSVLNLEQVIHHGPSTIGIDTLFKSNFNIPEVFLEGAGVPRKLIEYLPSFKNVPIQYYSCFISYSGKDETFATRLYEGLKSKGIRVWYAPEEMKGGRFLHDQIDQAIRLHDKLLLVLSDDSMNSTWVNTEIYKARKKERQSGKKVLFPISIVPHEKIQDWECFDADTGMDMARDIRRFYIPDFTRWKDHDSFQAEFEKLVRDLQASEEEK